MKKADTNPLLTTLRIIERLANHDTSAEQLAFLFDCSGPTLVRHIKEAKHMGADIVSKPVSSQGSKVWLYHLSNWSACSDRVRLWITLETERTVI